MTREVTLRHTPDLLGLRDLRFALERRGVGVAGSGVARQVVVPPGADQVARAARQAERALGAGGVAVGALPFDGTSPARLFVPHVVVRSSDDGASVLVTPRTPGAPEGCAASASPVTGDRYREAVRDALALIGAAEMLKVVLAREVEVDAGTPIDPVVVARRLRDADPGATTFVARTATGWLVGATPELLVGRAGARVWATPVAGSARRSADPLADERAANGLLASEKDLREHEPVAQAVIDALSPLCESLEFDESPVLTSTATMWHLGTRVRGTLRDPAPSVLSLAAALHPTPAVCGVPTDRAKDAIRRIEGFDRGCYTGIVGWMDAAGDGEWAIALRCAEVRGRYARLYAGGGIVAGSDPDAEHAETEAKLETMRRALRA